MEQALSQLIGSCLSIAIILLPIILFFYIANLILDKKKKEKEDTPPEEKEIIISHEQVEAPQLDNSNEYPYIRPYLLTKNEWSFYKALKPITDKYNIHILAKVRMADLVSVKSGLKRNKFQEAFTKIKSKHIDFVLANPNNLATLCAIELDDKSHNGIDEQKRDYFKDKVFETIGLPLIRTYSINGIEEQICNKLRIKIKP